jgi:hypothetical protein
MGDLMFHDCQMVARSTIGRSAQRLKKNGCLVRSA